MCLSDNKADSLIKPLLDIVKDLPPADISPAGLSPISDHKDIFAVHKRKGFNRRQDGRCDFCSYPGLRHTAALWVAYVWKKSQKGRLLTEIKADDEEVPHFALNTAAMIREMIAPKFDGSSWALVTTPMRRHKDRNFADLVCRDLSELLQIPYVRECAAAKSKQRIGAEFFPVNIPVQENLIIYDDIVTTGSTLKAMRDLLLHLGKKCLCIVSINNQ